MTLPKQTTVRKEKLTRLLQLNVIIAALLDGLSEEKENLLSMKLKDVILPNTWIPMQVAIKDADELCIGHLMHDFVTVTGELIDCVQEKQHSTSTETIQ